MILRAVLLVALAGCSDIVPPELENRMEARKIAQSNYIQSVRELLVLETNRGSMVFRLFPDDAPETVKQVRDWVHAGVYASTWFHRVDREPLPFVIQGGDIQSAGVDPAETENERKVQALKFGTGTTDPILAPETTTRKHVPGSLALAVSEDRSRAGPQFVIALSTLPHLDGQQPVFGQMVGGGSVLHALELGDRILRARLVEPEDIEGNWMRDLPLAVELP